MQCSRAQERESYKCGYPDTDGNLWSRELSDAERGEDYGATV